MNHIIIFYTNSIQPPDLDYLHNQILTYDDTLYYSIIKHVVEKGYLVSTRKQKMVYYIIIDTRRN